MIARKGVLISNPDVQKMTPIQWMFEYHSLLKKESHELDINIKLVKNSLVNILGLNLIRPRDQNGKVKPDSAMTTLDKESFLPLTAWIGHPELLKLVQEQVEQDLPPTLSSDAEYEKMVAAIDAAGGDMDPIINPEGINVEQVKTKQSHEVLNVKDISELKVDIDGAI